MPNAQCPPHAVPAGQAVSTSVAAGYVCYADTNFMGSDPAGGSSTKASAAACGLACNAFAGCTHFAFWATGECYVRTNVFFGTNSGTTHYAQRTACLKMITPGVCRGSVPFRGAVHCRKCGSGVRGKV